MRPRSDSSDQIDEIPAGNSSRVLTRWRPVPGIAQSSPDRHQRRRSVASVRASAPAAYGPEAVAGRRVLRCRQQVPPVGRPNSPPPATSVTSPSTASASRQRTRKQPAPASATAAGPARRRAAGPGQSGGRDHRQSRHRQPQHRRIGPVPGAPLHRRKQQYRHACRQTSAQAQRICLRRKRPRTGSAPPRLGASDQRHGQAKQHQRQRRARGPGGSTRSTAAAGTSSTASPQGAQRIACPRVDRPARSSKGHGRHAPTVRGALPQSRCGHLARRRSRRHQVRQMQHLPGGIGHRDQPARQADQQGLKRQKGDQPRSRNRLGLLPCSSVPHDFRRTLGSANRPLHVFPPDLSGISPLTSTANRPEEYTR